VTTVICMELRVVRVTDRFDDACHFYDDVLGWPVTRQWDEGGRGCIFGYGDVGRIELIEGQDAPVTGLFVAVETDDVAAMHRRFVERGVAVVQPLADQPWGHRNMGVVDPAGLTLIFFEVLGRSARAPDEGDRQVDLLAVSHDGQLGRRTGIEVADAADEIVVADDRASVDGNHDVTGGEPRVGGR
jgi:predicted enzyme related to lactoylglutathione lyase